MTLRPGDTFAGYSIEGVLGRGATSVVYEARQLSLNRSVALKVLGPELSDDELFSTRFRREALRQNRIEHPNVVPVYDAGEHGGALFVAMRLIRGGTLQDLVLSNELDGARTLRLLGPVAEALDHVHGAGLVHGAIRPQNILVGGRDHAYLADFAVVDAHSRVTDIADFAAALSACLVEEVPPVGEPFGSASAVLDAARVALAARPSPAPHS